MSTIVLSVWLGPENKYAFVEMATPECATIALGLNGMYLSVQYIHRQIDLKIHVLKPEYGAIFAGIQYVGMSLKFARPKTYTDSAGMGAGNILSMYCI